MPNDQPATRRRRTGWTMAAAAGLAATAAARAPESVPDGHPDARPDAAPVARVTPPAAPPPAAARPPAAPAVPTEPLATATNPRRDDPPGRDPWVPPGTLPPLTPSAGPLPPVPDLPPTAPSGPVSLIAGPGAAANSAAIDLPPAVPSTGSRTSPGPLFGTSAAQPVVTRRPLPISLPPPSFGEFDPVLQPPSAIGSPILVSAPFPAGGTAVPEPVAAVPIAAAALLGRRRRRRVAR